MIHKCTDIHSNPIEDDMVLLRLLILHHLPPVAQLVLSCGLAKRLSVELLVLKLVLECLLLCHDHAVGWNLAAFDVDWV